MLESNYTDPNGTFSVNPDGSVGSEIIWTGIISSNDSVNILIVIEDMLLDTADNLVINVDEKDKVAEFYGNQAPFSLVVKGKKNLYNS